MSRARAWMAAMMFAFVFGGGLLATVPVANAAACNARPFLTFPAWYRGLATGSECQIPATKKPEQFVPILLANIVEIILQLVGYVAVGFIIYGGFLYMIATGDPGKLAGAKTTILNAVIGLVIAIFAIGIVNFMTSRFV